MQVNVSADRSSAWSATRAEASTKPMPGARREARGEAWRVGRARAAAVKLRARDDLNTAELAQHRPGG
jgi:hypothetical protein